jgi:hypothetical protein
MFRGPQIVGKRPCGQQFIEKGSKSNLGKNDPMSLFKQLKSYFLG